MPYEKLTPESPEAHSGSPVDANVAALAELFPSIVQDGQVDFSALRTLLGDAVEPDENERFGLHWHGKKRARWLAMQPSLGTLRPCREESLNWDTTKNLYIEGDNLEVLKLLRRSYSGRVKMIYIDPPYNTGNDFVYKDDYQNNIENYKKITGQEGKYKVNQETDGRYHTEWLNMMYPRLMLARDLLAEDGIIFISIDDNELGHLKDILDEVYGSNNFVGYFIWNKTSKAPSLSSKIRKKHEYILCYTKGETVPLRGKESYNTHAPLFNRGNSYSERVFPQGALQCNFPDGEYSAGTYGEGDKMVELIDKLVVEHHFNALPVRMRARFSWGQATMDEYCSEGFKFMLKTSSMQTMYYDLAYKEKKFIAPSDIINKAECGVETNNEAHDALVSLFGGNNIFEYSKPVSLIKYLASFLDVKEGIFMDFFSGSATLGDAIMSLNLKDGGKRRFICVQLPEIIQERMSSSANTQKVTNNAITFLNSLHRPANICEIGKERIRRAGRKIKEEAGVTGQDLDVGFRVYKLDSSNVRAWNSEVESEDLLDKINQQGKHLVAERTGEDFLTEIMLKCGIDVLEEIEEREIAGHKVQSLGYGQYYACMDENLASDAEQVALGVAEWHREEVEAAGIGASDTGCVVFVLDQAFDGQDAAKMNFVEILKQYGISSVKAF